MSFTASLDEIVRANRNGLLGSAPGWGRKRLGSVAKVQNGYPFPSSRFNRTHGLPLVRIRDVRSESTEAFYDGAYEEEYLVEKDDLLIGMDGDFHVARWKGGRALLNQRVCKLVPDSSLLDARFLAYVLPGYLAAVHEHTSSITVKHLSSKTILDLPIPVPALTEQRRTVAEIEKQFTRLDAGGEALKRLQVHLRRYRAAVLLAATEGRLVQSEAELARGERRSYESGTDYLQRLLEERSRSAGPRWRVPSQPDVSKLPSLPEGWVWTNVASVGDVLLGRRRAPEYRASPHARPYLRVANVKDDRLALDDVLTMNWDDGDVDKYALRPNDILVSEGQSLDRVGQSAVYRGGIPGLCFQATLHRFRPLPSGPSSGFAQLVFRSHVRNGVFKRVASITTNIAHLTLEKFRAAPFPLPPAAEQIRIVAEAERLLSAADAAERAVQAQIRRTKTLRVSILQQGFAGGFRSRSAPLPNSQSARSPDRNK